ncbi:putative transferase, chloramphenicol acetyltransferase-like domain protein [Tanacetum coccineum]
MKKSLSLSLARYYPFAGTLRTETTPYVDCNDKGVVFVVAEINSQLSTFQHFSEEDETLDELFADGSVGNNCNGSNSLVAVQLNHFTCGGVAVAASMSHLIGDGCTLFSFVSHWASVTRYGSSHHKEVLPLNPSFIITPQEQVISNEVYGEGEGYVSTIIDSTKPQAQVMSNKVHGEGYVSKTFLFPNSKLSDLKNKVISEGSIKNPTRIEVLTSLIFKTAVGAESTRSGSFKPSFLWIPVDIRSKFVPKLPQITVGNFVSPMRIKTMHESELLLHLLVGEIKKEKMRLELVQSVQQAAKKSKMLRKNLENEIKDLENVANQTFCGSSFCGFSYNKVDFGWGKPAGATLPVRSVGITSFVLVDTADGYGVEARVNLKKENMEIFENDKEMLSFCHRT